MYPHKATYLAHVHAVNEDARHAKGGALLVDVGVIVALGWPSGTRMVHANGPLVVLHHENAWQLVQARHVQALIELACSHMRDGQHASHFSLPNVELDMLVAADRDVHHGKVKRVMDGTIQLIYNNACLSSSRMLLFVRTNIAGSVPKEAAADLVGSLIAQDLLWQT